MSDLVEIILRTALTLATIIALTRFQGLRSFSKMSGFDFAVTVSIGSVLAGAVTTLDTGLEIYVAALASLFAIQWTIAQFRARERKVESTLDNTPLLIMDGPTILEENLTKAGMTRADLFAKLRKANAFDLDTVHAVIVENTGDVSVLHGPADGPKPDEAILEGLRR